MNKALAFLYGVVCYVVFLVSFVYAIGFVGNLVVPKTIDSGPEVGLTEAFVVNLILLGLFAVQHTIMARPAFKKRWTKIIPEATERSTFVLVTSLLLLLLYWQWRPMPGVAWSVNHPAGKAVLTGLYFLGWGIVLLSSFLINHFDLFGLRQVWLYMRDQDYTYLEFKTTGLYAYIRHPIMLGFLIAFWATPHMTTGHLLFAIATSAYICVGIQFEERDLIQYHGEQYRDYRRKVPMLVPLPKRRRAPTDEG